MATIDTYGWNIVPIPMPDGSTEWWKVTDAWRLLRIDSPGADLATDVEVAEAIGVHTDLPDAHHTKTHAATHSEGGSDPVNALGTIHFTDKVYAGAGNDNQGQNQVVTIPNVCTLTFKKGILTKFELIVPP